MKNFLFLAPALFLLSCASGGMKAAYKYNNWESLPISGNTANRMPSSDIGSDTLSENNRVSLEKCGGANGYATMNRNFMGQLVVSVYNVNCNYYKTQFMVDEAKISTTAGNSDKATSFVVREDVPGWHKLVIGSKAYFTNPQPGSRADHIWFYVPAKTVNVDLYLQDQSAFYRIPGCGGTVQAQINNGMVNVIFRDVQNCDTVTMYKDDVAKTYKLNAQGAYNGGSYTIPRDLVDVGSNWVNFEIYKTYASEARIRVNFFGL